jgi:hypothetical protein
MDGLRERDVLALPLQGGVEGVVLDDGVLGAVIVGLDEDVGGVAAAHAEGVGEVAPGPGSGSQTIRSRSAGSDAGSRKWRAGPEDADMPEVAFRRKLMGAVRRRGKKVEDGGGGLRTDDRPRKTDDGAQREDEATKRTKERRAGNPRAW